MPPTGHGAHHRRPTVPTARTLRGLLPEATGPVPSAPAPAAGRRHTGTRRPGPGGRLGSAALSPRLHPVGAADGTRALPDGGTLHWAMPTAALHVGDFGQAIPAPDLS